MGADLAETEGPIDAEAAPDAIRQAAAEFEPAVREATDTDAPYELTIEKATVDAYWRTGLTVPAIVSGFA